MKKLFYNKISIYLKTLGLVLLFSAILVSCSSQPRDKGVVAEVNGVPIFFSELDAQRNMLFSGLSIEGLPPEDKILRAQYSYAVTQLIQQELIRQYLVKKKINIDESQVVKEEFLIQTDHHASDNFKKALLDSGISPEIWHNMMLKRQTVLTFVSEVLRPDIRISSEEVEKYYLENKESFLIPEQWHFMQITGKDKEEVAAARDSFIKSLDAKSIGVFKDIMLRNVRMGRDRLPEESFKTIEKQKTLEPGAIKTDSDGYVTYVLLEKISANTLSAAETYKIVEQILLEDKIQEKLTAWMNKQYGKASIRISTYLLNREKEESKDKLTTVNNDTLSDDAIGNSSLLTNSTEFVPEDFFENTENKLPIDAKLDLSVEQESED